MDMLIKPLTIEVTKPSIPNSRLVTSTFYVETNHNLVNKANLGTTHQTCRICDMSGKYLTWQAIEVLQGTGEHFNYFICSNCECMQIEQIPKNIGKYYDHSYYSFGAPNIQPIPTGVVRDEKMILDVGCGAGNWLHNLATKGCVNLFGCDPYIEKDIEHSNGVKLYKKSIHEMEDTYDVINFSHAFEHMPDPHEVFITLKRLLKTDGNKTGEEEPKITMTLPGYPNLIHDIYGTYTHLLDIPRHFFIYSSKSISLLAENNGFFVESINTLEFHSTFYRALFCLQGMSWPEADKKFHSNRNETQKKEYSAYCDLLGKFSNLAGCGGHVSYVIKRKEGNM